MFYLLPVELLNFEFLVGTQLFSIIMCDAF